MHNVEGYSPDRTYTAVCWRMTESARAMINETKGYTTGRDEVTIDTIVRAVAFELLNLGLIEPDGSNDS